MFMIKILSAMPEGKPDRLMRDNAKNFFRPVHVEIPPVPPSAKAGDVHIHRNRLKDEVRIWILTGNLQWDDCSTSWAIKTKFPVRHPIYPGLILNTFGSSYIPSYIKEATYKSRSADRLGLAKV